VNRHRIIWLDGEVRTYPGELEAAADLDGIYGREEWRWNADHGTVELIYGPGDWRAIAHFEELLPGEELRATG
jgi:hypothetical protein